MSVNRLKWIAPLLVGLISVLAKGSPQSLQVEGDRLVLPKASYSKWQGTVIPGVPETMREWIGSYLEELPNFVCDYKESRSEMFREGWVLMDTNEGQVRHVDGKSDFLVEIESGIPTNKQIWEVTSASLESFSSFFGVLSPSTNYRFTPNGEGLFTFQSDAGIHLFNGFTRDGVKRGVKNYPTWGTVQLEKSSHAIREFIEYLRVPERGMLAGLFTSGFRAGEHSWLREFGYVDVGEKSYWLPKREEIKSIYSDPKHDPQRVVQTYDNCRRFEVDSTIRYGNAVDASQPGFKQATGGTGSELGTTTEALEKGENTGLEVGANLDSAGFAGRSPNIPPQAPPAASQPPLSKAVRTSPKRNAPSEDRPPRSPRHEKESLLKRYGYHSTAPYEDEEDRPLLSRYGYVATEYQPPEPEEDSFIPSRYGYYASDFDRPPLREPPPEDEQVPEDDRSVFWWFVSTGILAFVGSFLGNFLRGRRG